MLASVSNYLIQVKAKGRTDRQTDRELNFYNSKKVAII